MTLALFKSIGDMGHGKLSYTWDTGLWHGRPASTGPLTGGSPMSHVEFKKWSCPMSLILKKPVIKGKLAHTFNGNTFI